MAEKTKPGRARLAELAVGVERARTDLFQRIQYQITNSDEVSMARSLEEVAQLAIVFATRARELKDAL